MCATETVALKRTRRVKLFWSVRCKGKRGGRTVIGRKNGGIEYIKDRLIRLKPSENDLVFPVHHREAFTELLKAADLHIEQAHRV